MISFFIGGKYERRNDRNNNNIFHLFMFTIFGDKKKPKLKVIISDPESDVYY